MMHTMAIRTVSSIELVTPEPTGKQQSWRLELTLHVVKSSMLQNRGTYLHSPSTYTLAHVHIHAYTHASTHSLPHALVHIRTHAHTHITHCLNL